MRRLIFLLSLFIASAAQALPDYVTVHPAAPTTETSIRLAVISSCSRGETYTVEKKAGEVLLIGHGGGTCPSPPIPYLDQYVSIGTLPAGAYRVGYRHSGGDDVVRNLGEIIVRHAASPTEFDIHPFAVRTNPAGLRMRVEPLGDLAICATANCSDTTIRVGGAIAANVVPDRSGNGVTFDAPPHGAGFADVVIEKTLPAVTWTYPAAIYYFDSPKPGVFERILFPVLFDAPGANGSDWRSEAAISNPNPFVVENYNSLESIVCITYPCGERVAPGAYTRLSGGMFPQGAILLVPSPEAPLLDFALRIRDVSRAAEGFGTEIPVVRESDFVLDRDVRLLDVPLDPRYRVKVRVYALDPPSNYVVLKTLAPETGAERSRRNLQTPVDCRFLRTCAAFTPWYVEHDLAPTTAGDRVVVSIEAPRGTLLWAFATVTNNTTQQVTVVTPQ